MHREFFKANDGRRVRLVEYYGEGPDGSEFKRLNPCATGKIRFREEVGAQENGYAGAYTLEILPDEGRRGWSFYSLSREGKPCEGGFLWEYENNPGDTRVACRFEFVDEK